MTDPATDEQIAELEALLEFTPFSTKGHTALYAAFKETLPALLARLRAAEAEAERIRAEERERWAEEAKASARFAAEVGAVGAANAMEGMATALIHNASSTQGDPNANN